MTYDEQKRSSHSIIWQDAEYHGDHTMQTVITTIDCSKKNLDKRDHSDSIAPRWGDLGGYTMTYRLIQGHFPYKK